MITRFASAALLLMMVGCTRTLDILVVDIETRQPIPRAQLRTHYNVFLGDFFPPKAQTFVGDDQGVVKVQIARGWERRCHLQPSAEGYEGGYLTREGSSIEPITSPVGYPQSHATLDIFPNFNDGSPFPKTLIAELWKAPGPRFTVILPDGFRGRVFPVGDMFNVVDLALGQRMIEVRADANGHAALPLTRPILTGFSRDEVAYRFESGAEIPKAFPVYTRNSVVIRGTSAKPDLPADTVAVRQMRGGLYIGRLHEPSTLPTR